MVKIVCIADTHLDWNKVKVPDGDIFIHAGDWEAFFTQHISEFNRWLGKLPHKHKIVIAGNHDKFVAENGCLVKEMITNAIYLENSGCKVMGLKFWGSPITPRFGDWFFMKERGSSIRRYWDEIPMGTDVLITHGPPYGIMDYVPYSYGSHNVGCKDLLEVINKIKPKVHIFGHIHGGYGLQPSDTTLFINASVMDESYTVVNKPIEITVE